ncbi:MAG: polysulfide reductase NrfD [Actinomycetota bacterium]|jgi:molybdopterin-containing oxidoreductase family membrane subunit|nr:polysulfide reductase NrfD [Actinomycetota bacterium]
MRRSDTSIEASKDGGELTNTEELSDVPELPDVRAASMRPVLKPGRWYWPVVGALVAVVAVGVVAWVTQLHEGLGAAGYNNHAFWAIYIADVVTFIGVSYGGAVVSAILRLTGASWRAPLTRIAEATAVVTVIIGGSFIIPHLGRPERILELIYRPNLSSPIFWDFVAVSTYAFASIVFFFLPLMPDLAMARDRLTAANRPRLARLCGTLSCRWQAKPSQRRRLDGAIGLVAIMVIPLAVSVHSVLSWAFTLTSRPWWHESIWAPYFVVAALYSGIALVIIVVAVMRRIWGLKAFITDRHLVRLGFILAPFGAAYLYLTIADFLPGSYVGENGVANVFAQVLAGRYALWFWLFVFAGLIVPLLIIALPWTRRAPFIVTAAALVVGSLWIKRMVMVVAPANYGRVSGVFGSYHFTWISACVTLAGVAAIPLLLLLVFRVVPILSVTEMEEMAARKEQEAMREGADRALAEIERRHDAGESLDVQVEEAEMTPVGRADA